MGSEELLSHQAGICLICACENPNNRLGRFLLMRTGALTATGVCAALFLAEGADRCDVLVLARGAIAEQRESCLSDGLFHSARCPEVVRNLTGTYDE